MVDVREVLRGWLEGAGLRKIAERSGVDRKTARRYVAAAQAEGLVREAGLEALSDELIGAVVAAVRPARPNGHGAAWDLLLAHEEQIKTWVAGAEGQPALSVVKIEELLARAGCVVPYRTLHRFAVERCGFRVKTITVRINDGEPGVECQIDFAQMGFILDPEIGKKRAEYFLGTALLVADAAGCEQHLLAAIAGARASGDTQTEFVAANNLVSYHESAGSPARGRDLANEMIERARLSASATGSAECRCNSSRWTGISVTAAKSSLTPRCCSATHSMRAPATCWSRHCVKR